MASVFNPDFHQRHRAARRPLHALGLATASDIQRTSRLPWLPLRLPFPMPFEAMLAEAKNLRECFVPHRQKEANCGWYSLCLHGLSSVHIGPHDRYGFVDATAPYGWTDICKFCPVTQNFLQSFGYRWYHRVRFMLLTPGGYIAPHADSSVDRLEAVNIALNNPVGCEFVMADAGIVPLTAGVAMMLSLSRQHSVWNQSDEDRYHVIVHGSREPAIWDQIVVESYNDIDRTRAQLL